MTEDEWCDFYKPKTNHIDDNASWSGTMFETYGEEVDFVISTPENFVWTLVEVDGKGIVVNGYSYVNRLGYFVCEVPWKDDGFFEIVVYDCGDEEGEEMLTKDEMLDKYTVKGFAMGWAIVERKEDGVRGSLDFDSHNGVRYYYNFQEA